MPTLFTLTIDSLVGPLRLTATTVGLSAVARGSTPLPAAVPSPEILERARAQLTEYFAGRRRRFDLPLDPAGTPFQRRVWRALGEIPYGATSTYGALARAMGHPGAARAVGAANARNPLWIVVPCHRVIGADGRLTGFAGGLEMKHALLALERDAVAAP